LSVGKLTNSISVIEQCLHEKFSQGYSKIAHDARLGSVVEIATEATVQRVERLIRADGRITIDSVATALVCSRALAYSIIHDLLRFRKVCTRWVPRELKVRKKKKKMNRMGLSLQHLLCNADEGEDMFNRIVTIDESWVHHYQPESKRASVRWKHPSSLSEVLGFRTLSIVLVIKKQSKK
jgi:hypothetical protein